MSSPPWDSVEVVEDVPHAVWEGKIMGIRVYVLSDGRRIIDADDLTDVFERIGSGDLDPDAFAKALASAGMS